MGPIESVEDLMKRLRTLMLPLALLLVSAACWAAPVDLREGAGPAAVSGLYSVTFNVNLGATVPAGSSVTCKAKVTPNSSLFENLSRGTVPVKVAAGAAAIVGNRANCSVEIPFSWMVNDPRNGVALSYEIEAVSGSGALLTAVRASSPQGIGVAYPPAGGAASVNINVAF